MTTQLIGSQKQIDWAIQIRTTQLSALKNELETISRRLASGDFAQDSTYATKYRDTLSKMHDTFANVTDAKKIIDARNTDVVNVARKVAGI